jgi:hypothetical protein
MSIPQLIDVYFSDSALHLVMEWCVTDLEVVSVHLFKLFLYFILFLLFRSSEPRRSSFLPPTSNAIF